MQPSPPARTPLVRDRCHRPSRREWRRWRSVLLPAALVLCWLSVSAPAAVTAQSGGTTALATIISQDGLNLRSSPGTTSPVLGSIPFGTVITLTGAPTSDNWYPVSFGTTSGWALGDYLSAGEVDPVTAQNAPPLTAALAASLGLGPATAVATTAILTPPAAPTDSANSALSPTSYSATASYYGIDDGAVAGEPMACGSPVDPTNAAATATNDWPCGTRLRVTGPAGNSIVVTVTDHGEYPSHWLDLTYAAFGRLADHKLGTIHVSVTVVP